MKKITLSILLLLFNLAVFSQIAIIEDFEGGIPGDWTNNGYFASPDQSCSGMSLRDNLYSGSSTGSLETVNVVGLSNATDLNLSFDYKIVDWSAATVATAPGWGNFVVEYSTNDGTDWILVDTINDDNHVTSNECANMSYTIASADLPMGSDFKLRINSTWVAGDYYLYLDNITAVQTADAAPSCDSVLTAPADGSSDNEINGNIAWSSATGIPTGYFLTAGTTPGGNDVLDNEDVGNVTSYALGQLLYETTYYVTIVAYNDNGTTTDTCTEQSFTTKLDPSQVIDCMGDPLNINYCYDNNDDTFWLFTSSDGSPLRITFNAGGIESCCDDIIIYDGVDNTGDILYQGNNGGDLSGLQFDSLGSSIYMEIDADGSVSCASGSGCCTDEWDFTVVCGTCVNPQVTYDVRSDCVNGPQFFLDVDLTDLGDATSITISDDQGSTPFNTTETGLFTFGPFANETEVVITVANDQDSNCTLTSSELTQPFCLDNYIDCNEGPQVYNYCYGDDNTNVFTFTSSDGSPLNFVVNSGFVAWNEFSGDTSDPLIVYDTDGTTELYNGGGTEGDLSGIQLQSTGDTISFTIQSNGFTSCGSGSAGLTDGINYTVSCATCVLPQVAFSVNEDCENGAQFFVDADITDLGSATSLTLTDDQGSAPQVINATGVYSFGPFANNTNVVVTATNDQDGNCTVFSPTLTQEQCILNLVDCNVGPTQINYCYDNNDETTWLFRSTDGSPLRITFNEGGIESCCDEILIYDGPDNTGTLLYQGNNGGDLAGLQFDSLTDEIFMEIDADGSVSCASGSTCCTTEWDFTVACGTCVNPQVTYDVRSDCVNGPQFFLDVDLTDLGDATSITLSDDQGSTPFNTTETGLFTFGPFANETEVIITVANDQDVNCTLMSSPLTQPFCLDNYIDCTEGPQSYNYCYEDDNTNVFVFTSSDGTPLNLVINSGFVAWNEFSGDTSDPLIVYDTDGTTELYNGGGNVGDLSGLVFQSTGDTISFTIQSNGFTSCASGSDGLTDGINYTVSCATCILPQATYAIIDDCENGEQFLIDVDVTSIGDATSLTISDNQGSAPVQVTEAGIVQMGPYPFLTDVIITITNDQDGNCEINSQPFQLAACPPINDNCPNAIVAEVNNSFFCDTVNSGTLIEATPSIVPPSSCGNSNNDVWYVFTATSEVHLISLENLSGGFVDFNHSVYEGADCGNLTELYCSNDDASITPFLTIGSDYYIRVFTGGNDAENIDFELCIKEAPSNTICENAANFCGNAGGLEAVNIIGAPNSSSVACLGTIPNPSWNIIQIGSSGPISMTIQQNTEFDDDGNPVGTPLDVDFVLWGPFESNFDFCTENLLVDCPSCPNNTTNPDFYPFENIVDCSYDAASTETVTIDNAIEGEVYALLVTNFSNQVGEIRITGYEPEDIVSEIDAELISQEVSIDTTNPFEEVDVVELCGFESLTLEVDSPFADYYEWYRDGFLIEGENTLSLTVTESDTYQVNVFDEDCGASTFTQIVDVRFYKEASAETIADIQVCDGPVPDGEEEFDLNALIPTILGTQDPADFTVRFYGSQDDANNAENELASPYTNTSSPQTIYIRVEDNDAIVDEYLSCRAISQFNIEVLGGVDVGTPDDMSFCSATGVAEFMLTDNDSVVLDGQNPADFTVSYHANQDDADSGENALTSPYTNTSPSQTVVVRVENIATGCYGTASFTISATDPTHTATSVPLIACDNDEDGMSEFDLLGHTGEILDGQDGSQFNVTYHATQADAEANVSALPDLYTSSPTTIYVRVELVGTPDCYVVTGFDLEIDISPIASFDINFFYEVCPNATVPIEITATANNFDPSNVSIRWFLDGDEISGQTGLTLPVLVAGTYEIEVTFNDSGCFDTFSQEVIELEFCEFPQGISPGVSDGANDTFDLKSFNVTRLEIYNRNGIKVYSKDNYRDEWHGQDDSDNELPVGTYFYHVVYEGGAKTKTAWVYLNR